MSAYRKQIEVTDTGMVIAKVFSPEGRRVGLQFFESGMFELAHTAERVERRAKKAHEWADEYIAMCQRQEVMP